jgi:ribA/ribD-fused uncharacterized protein
MYRRYYVYDREPHNYQNRYSTTTSFKRNKRSEKMNHKLDTNTHVFFYENDFYVLSNFSAFGIWWKGQFFMTSEHAYHWEKFYHSEGGAIQHRIHMAPSAHLAFKIAQENRSEQRPDWDNVKADIMRDILEAKVNQHEYVKRKLIGTGNRWLVEDSWRDDFWGWGEDGKGQNMLGRLWMEIRDELRSK